MREHAVNEYEQIAELIEERRKRFGRQERRARWLRWGWRLLLVGGIAALLLI